MSVQDETWDRPTCHFCEKTILYGKTFEHGNGKCTKVVYAIGRDSGGGGVGMWYGPTNLRACLLIPGEQADAIWRLDGESSEIVYRWDGAWQKEGVKPFTVEDQAAWSKKVADRIQQEGQKHLGLVPLVSDWNVRPGNGEILLTIRIRPRMEPALDTTTY